MGKMLNCIEFKSVHVHIHLNIYFYDKGFTFIF